MNSILYQIMQHLQMNKDITFSSGMRVSVPASVFQDESHYLGLRWKDAYYYGVIRTVDDRRKKINIDFDDGDNRTIDEQLVQCTSIQKPITGVSFEFGDEDMDIVKLRITDHGVLQINLNGRAWVVDEVVFRDATKTDPASMFDGYTIIPMSRTTYRNARDFVGKYTIPHFKIHEAWTEIESVTLVIDGVEVDAVVNMEGLATCPLLNNWNSKIKHLEWNFDSQRIIKEDYNFQESVFYAPTCTFRVKNPDQRVQLQELILFQKIMRNDDNAIIFSNRHTKMLLDSDDEETNY